MSRFLHQFYRFLIVQYVSTDNATYYIYCWLKIRRAADSASTLVSQITYLCEKKKRKKYFYFVYSEHCFEYLLTMPNTIQWTAATRKESHYKFAANMVLIELPRAVQFFFIVLRWVIWLVILHRDWGLEWSYTKIEYIGCLHWRRLAVTSSGSKEPDEPELIRSDWRSLKRRERSPPRIFSCCLIQVSAELFFRSGGFEWIRGTGRRRTRRLCATHTPWIEGGGRNCSASTRCITTIRPTDCVFVGTSWKWVLVVRS